MKIKKFAKITVWIVAFLAVVITAVALLISPVVKHYVLSHDKELVGRRMALDKLDINVFNGQVSLYGFEIKDTDDVSKFLTLNHFEAKLSPLRLLGKEIIVRNILFDSLSVGFQQNKEYFSINDIIEHFTSNKKTSASDEPSALADWGVGLYNFVVRRSDILYEDLDVGSRWFVDEVRLTVPDVYFGPNETNSDGVGVNLVFPDGGTLYTKTSLDSDNNYTLNVVLRDFELSGTKPYLQKIFHIQKFTGLLNADVDITGNLHHILDFSIAGNVAGRNVLMHDNFGKTVMAAETAKFVFDRVNFGSQTYILDTMDVRGVKSYLALFSNSKNNFTDFMVNDAQNADSTENAGEFDIFNPVDSLPLTLKIAYANVERGSFDFTDSTMTHPFSYLLGNIRLKARDFDLNGKNDITASAALGSKGTVHARLRGKVYDINNINLSLGMENVSLTDFTPYTLHYFAYPIESGDINFESQNVITGGNLKGTNKLEGYQCKAGPKDKTITPEYKVPLRLGLYVLNDRNQHIKINLPVSGKISSPDFSYKKIVFKTICNLFVKIAVSPFKFLADALGIGGQNLNEVEFDVSKMDFPLDSYAKFDKIADAFSSKPDMTLQMTQMFDYNQQRRKTAMNVLRASYYKSANPDKKAEIYDMLEQEEIMKIQNNDPQMGAFADSLVSVRSIQLNGSGIEDKALALYGSEADRYLSMSVDMHNKRLGEYLTVKKSIPSDKFTVSSMSLDSMKIYKGKSIYKVDMSMSGEQLEEDVETESETEPEKE